MPQYFKGDAEELKFDDSAWPIIEALNTQKEIFLGDSYSAFPLGELLYDTERAPLANAIPREIFREAFFAVFNAFIISGSFESYLTVFRAVFGPDVEVEFVVPAPGKLEINIIAAGLESLHFIAREISGDEYVLSDMVDHNGDNIVFRTVKGFETQYELEQMLFELVPAGIFTDIDLDLGA